MQGIFSRLDVEATRQVAGIYAELEQRFGLRGVQAFPYPHISYHILDGYSLSEVETRLNAVSARLKPFKVKTSGLGIFLKPQPVLFVPVVRGPALERVHRQLWRTFPSPEGKAGYYSASEWMPHITLVRADLTRELMPQVIDFLSERDFHWEITLDNLAFAAEVDGGFEIQCSFQLGPGFS